MIWLHIRIFLWFIFSLLLHISVPTAVLRLWSHFSTNPLWCKREQTTSPVLMTHRSLQSDRATSTTAVWPGFMKGNSHPHSVVARKETISIVYLRNKNKIQSNKVKYAFLFLFFFFSFGKWRHVISSTSLHCIISAAFSPRSHQRHSRLDNH